MDKKKLQVWIPLLLSLSMVAGMFIGFKLKDSFTGNSFFFIQRPKTIEEVFTLIKNNYVDDVDIDKLQDTAIVAMLNKLDPHTSFISADEVEEMNEEIDGSFFGIGIEFDLLNDTLNVVNVLKGGPAEKSGILQGDQLIKINGTVVSGKKMQSDSIRKIFRGERGTLLKTEILRNGKPITLSVERDMIIVNSVESSYMLDRETGYIRLEKFSTQTYKEFMTALDSLKRLGMKKLVFDLRNNGGGVLDEAVEIADEFLDGDKLITYTEGRHSPKKEYRCRRTGQFEKGALVVLADETSASASEVIMGALQDWKRATIIGRRSFGKGLVQEQYELSDHSALRITVARYFTPLGRSIQRSYANGGKAYYEEIEKRMSGGIDSVNLKTGKDASEKKLFENGGILPDVYVVADTSRNNSTLSMLYFSGALNQASFLICKENPKIKTTFKTPVDFANGFTPTIQQIQLLQKLAEKDSININKINEAQKSEMIKYLKANIARQIWYNDGYYQVLNKTDKDVLKAMEVLR